MVFRLHLFGSKGSNFPEGVVIVIIKKGVKGDTA